MSITFYFYFFPFFLFFFLLFLTKKLYTRYFVVQNLAGNDESQVIRYSALLRGTESGWQALSYGLEALTIFAQHGGVYMNFALWAISLAPAWLVVRHFGVNEEAGGSVEGGASAAEIESSDSREEQLK